MRISSIRLFIGLDKISAFSEPNKYKQN